MDPGLVAPQNGALVTPSPCRIILVTVFSPILSLRYFDCLIAKNVVETTRTKPRVTFNCTTEILKRRGMLYHDKTTYNTELHGRKGNWDFETQLKIPLSHSFVNLTALNLAYRTIWFFVLLKFYDDWHGTKTRIRNDLI
jgi:hypothetical protein